MAFKTDKRNTNGFDKNPQNCNRKGRPKKFLSSVIDEFKAAGHDRIKPWQVAEAYEYLLGLSREEIVKVSNDQKSPMLLAIVANAMYSKKGPEMLERLLDRAHGKAVQKIEAEVSQELSLKEKNLLSKIIGSEDTEGDGEDAGGE